MIEEKKSGLKKLSNPCLLECLSNYQNDFNMLYANLKTVANFDKRKQTITYYLHNTRTVLEQRVRV